MIPAMFMSINHKVIRKYNKISFTGPYPARLVDKIKLPPPPDLVNAGSVKMEGIFSPFSCHNANPIHDKYIPNLRKQTSCATTNNYTLRRKSM